MWRDGLYQPDLTYEPQESPFVSLGIPTLSYTPTFDQFDNSSFKSNSEVHLSVLGKGDDTLDEPTDFLSQLTIDPDELHPVSHSRANVSRVSQAQSIVQVHSLSSYLASFFSPESITASDSHFCPNCRTRAPSLQRTFSLLEPPQTLILHLKRFDSNLLKINHPVALAPPNPYSGAIWVEIDTNWVSEPTPTRACSSAFAYVLCGAVLHHGILQGGHYTALIFNSGGWWCCDDQSVQSETASNAHYMIQNSGYILLLQRAQLDVSASTKHTEPHSPSEIFLGSFSSDFPSECDEPNKVGDSFEKIPPGLVNHGNTCFLNAILQCLAVCSQNWSETHLAEWILERRAPSQMKELAVELKACFEAISLGKLQSSKERLTRRSSRYELREPSCILSDEPRRVLYKLRSMHKESTSIAGLTRIFGRKSTFFVNRTDLSEPGVQQDAAEALLHILDALRESISWADNLCPFEGCLASSIRCNSCDHTTSCPQEKFTTLSIPISLDQSKEEENSNDWRENELLQRLLSSWTLSDLKSTASVNPGSVYYRSSSVSSLKWTGL